MKHSRSRVTNNLIPIDTLNAFVSEFCTLGMIRTRQPEVKALKLRDFQAQKIKPAITATDGRSIYRWRNIPIEKLIALAK